MRVLRPEDVQPEVRVANYFDTPPGAAWPRRTIPDLELILVVAGRFAYIPQEGEAVESQAGDVVCILPEVRHTFCRTDRSRRATISCIHAEFLPGASLAAGHYALDPLPPLRVETRGDPALAELFRSCAQVYEGFGRYRTALASALVKAIWLRLAEYWTGQDRQHLPLRLKAMLAFLQDHLLEPVSRRDLAAAFHLTPERVNAFFKQHLGISPTQYVHRERVLRAYRLLREDGLRVKEAAARVGFSDPFFFSKVFKKVMGMPPSAVRG